MLRSRHFALQAKGRRRDRLDLCEQALARRGVAKPRRFRHHRGVATWLERWFGRWRKPQPAAVSTGVVWHLRIERERSAVGKLNDWLEQKLTPSVPEDALRALQVAFDELLTNVIMHAEQTSGPIELQLARSQGALDATISYLAAPFDPTQRRTPERAQSVADSDIGGWGIPLVRALMDDFRHEYVDGRNVLHLKKKC